MRLFETLDILNQNDDRDKTATAGCCFEMVACDVKGNNGYVKMGVPSDVAMNIINDIINVIARYLLLWIWTLIIK